MEYKLVPDEPTPEMIASGLAKFDFICRVGMPEYGSQDAIELMWSAMIDAAPVIEQEPTSVVLRQGTTQTVTRSDPESAKNFYAAPVPQQSRSDQFFADRNADAQQELYALRQAAKAVIERWDTPKWKDAGPTGAVINRLRAVLNQAAPVPQQAMNEGYGSVARAALGLIPAIAAPVIEQEPAAIFQVVKLSAGMRRLDWIKNPCWDNLPQGRYPLYAAPVAQQDDEDILRVFRRHGHREWMSDDNRVYEPHEMLAVARAILAAKEKR